LEPFPLGVLGFGALPVFFSWPRTLGLALNICVGWENVTEFDEGGLLVNVCEDDGSDWNRKGGERISNGDQERWCYWKLPKKRFKLLQKTLRSHGSILKRGNLAE